MKRFALVAVVVTGLAVFASQSSASPAAHWVVTDLAAQARVEFPHFTEPALVGITPGGRVIWTAQRPDGTQWEREVFQWRNGHMTDLGPLPRHTVPLGLNAGGALVGTSQDAPYCGYGSPPACRSGPRHAYLWQPGKLTLLGSLGGADSQAWAINDRGQVVGSSETANGKSHAFLWQNGKLTDLGTGRGTESDASAINNRGQILEDITVGKTDQTVLWQHGKTTPIASFRNCEWATFNDRGQVLGQCPKHGSIRGLLWTNGRTTDLGADSQDGPMAINNRGDVIESLRASEESSRGILWRDGQKIDLGSLGGPQTFPVALNESDEVVGISSVPGRDHGFLVFHPFLWQNGKMMMLPGGAANLDVMDINAAGTLIAGGTGAFECDLHSCAGHLLVWRYVR